MKFAEIRSRLEGVPFITPEQARTLYDFVCEQRPEESLELGFGHGASSCYIAAALQEAGGGHLTCVDLWSAVEWQKPRIEELLQETGLADYVTVSREKTSYTWFLKNKIEERTAQNACEPIYDFCFLDGAKHWTIDSSAFFLVDKLLKTGGWILFDDLQWTFESKLARGKELSDGISLREMSEDELKTPHVELIFRLLVMQHPSYSEFRIQDGCWGWAHKTASEHNRLVYEERYTLKALAARALRRLSGRKP
jgi:predicted O-methyltransferase YrrM